MNFIIYDLEATCWKGKPRSKVQETIEIGAVCLNEYGEVRDTFSRFIRPVLNPYLSAFCQELTTITQVDVNRAEKFPRVIDDFIDWAEIYDEEYLLCSWGDFDRKQLIRDCELHDLEAEWIEEHINVKQQYREILKLPKAKGLRRAVLAEGYEFTGIHHRAISDAENLAKLFISHLDEWQY